MTAERGNGMYLITDKHELIRKYGRYIACKKWGVCRENCTGRCNTGCPMTDAEVQSFYTAQKAEANGQSN